MRQLWSPLPVCVAIRQLAPSIQPRSRHPPVLYTRDRRAFDLSAIAASAAPKVNIDASNEVSWTYATAMATAMPIPAPHLPPTALQRRSPPHKQTHSCCPDTNFHYYDTLLLSLTLLHHHDHHLVQIIYHFLLLNIPYFDSHTGNISVLWTSNISEGYRWDSNEKWAGERWRDGIRRPQYGWSRVNEQ